MQQMLVGVSNLCEAQGQIFSWESPICAGPNLLNSIQIFYLDSLCYKTDYTLYKNSHNDVSP